jgi:excisionase family DNA binding protein
MEDKYLTTDEVAKILRVSTRSVFRYIKNGRLKAIKVGYWRIAKKELDGFIEANSNIKDTAAKRFTA